LVNREALSSSSLSEIAVRAPPSVGTKRGPPVAICQQMINVDAMVTPTD